MLHGRRARFLSSAVLLGVVSFGTAYITVAAGPGEPNALVPYHGHLEHNGTPMNGVVDVRVGLFTSAGADASCLWTGTTPCGAWSDTFANVAVAYGNFALSLGSNANLPTTTFFNNGVFLGIAVDNGTGFVGVGGLQRLASVPYAVRGEQATDFLATGAITVDGDADLGNDVDVGRDAYIGRDATVIRNLGIGIDAASAQEQVHIENGALRVRDDDNAADPDIAAFYALNLTQGIGIGYNRVSAIGSNASQDIVVEPKGSGTVILDGNTDVNGSADLGATTVEAYQNINGTVSTYTTSLVRRRYVATWSGSSPTRRYVDVPYSVLVSYCGDEDGCRVTLRMRGWNTSSQRGTATTFTFHYGSDGHWRVNSNVDGNDGNGSTNHAMQLNDCYFTDSRYAQGASDQGDSQLGMGLLNWDDTYDVSTQSCELIIND